jgi:hypothetical protein
MSLLFTFFANAIELNLMFDYLNDCVRRCLQDAGSAKRVGGWKAVTDTAVIVVAW